MKTIMGIAAGLLLVAAAAFGQSYLPVPSGVVEADQILVGVDGNNVQGSSRITPSALTVGSDGTSVAELALYSVYITPEAVTAQSCEEQSFGVAGVVTGQHIAITGHPIPTTASTIVAARISDPAGLFLMFCNPVAVNTVPDAGVYKFLGLKPG